MKRADERDRVHGGQDERSRPRSRAESSKCDTSTSDSASNEFSDSEKSFRSRSTLLMFFLCTEVRCKTSRTSFSLIIFDNDGNILEFGRFIAIVTF